MASVMRYLSWSQMFHHASLFHFLLSVTDCCFLCTEALSCSDLQSSATVVQEKAEVEAAKGVAEGQAGRLTQEVERLRRRAQELENEVAKLNRIIDEAKLQESRLGDKVGRLEVRGKVPELQLLLVLFYTVTCSIYTK